MIVLEVESAVEHAARGQYEGQSRENTDGIIELRPLEDRIITDMSVVWD